MDQTAFEFLKLFLTVTVAAIPGIVGLIIAYKRLPKEQAKLDAESAKTFSEAAQNYAEELTRIQVMMIQREKEHQSEIESLKQKQILTEGRLAELERKNIELSEKLSEVESWAERLVHQVQSLGGNPVGKLKNDDIKRSKRSLNPDGT
jgi:site-specific recombinase XerC